MKSFYLWGKRWTLYNPLRVVAKLKTGEVRNFYLFGVSDSSGERQYAITQRLRIENTYFDDHARVNIYKRTAPDLGRHLMERP